MTRRLNSNSRRPSGSNPRRKMAKVVSGYLVAGCIALAGCSNSKPEEAVTIATGQGPCAYSFEMKMSDVKDFNATVGDMNLSLNLSSNCVDGKVYDHDLRVTNISSGATLLDTTLNRGSADFTADLENGTTVTQSPRSTLRVCFYNKDKVEDSNISLSAMSLTVNRDFCSK